MKQEVEWGTKPNRLEENRNIEKENKPLMDNLSYFNNSKENTQNTKNQWSRKRIDWKQEETKTNPFK